MKTYIGTKVVTASPMNRADYNILRGWTLPDDEDGEDEGYLVEYTDGGKPNHAGYKGYISWSPTEQFERAYCDTHLGYMNFGGAVSLLKAGRKVAREGWNGKGMWLILVPGTKVVNFTEGSPYMKAGLTSGEILPHIDMYTTNSEGRRAMLPGWVASQSDILADDWLVVS
jgi:hypothetical protein